MAFFENLSKKVQDVAYVAAEKGKEVAAVAGEKAQDAAETVKTNVAIAGEQRAIEKNYRAIGEWYVSGLGDAIPEEIADIVKAIRESQAKITELQESKNVTVRCERTTETVQESEPCAASADGAEAVSCECAAAAAEEASEADFADAAPAQE